MLEIEIKEINSYNDHIQWNDSEANNLATSISDQISLNVCYALTIS